MTHTVLIDLSDDFAARARKGDTTALQTIAKDNGLEMDLLCPKRDNCATFYMVGAKACDAGVVEQLRAVNGVVAVTALSQRKQVTVR